MGSLRRAAVLLCGVGLVPGCGKDARAHLGSDPGESLTSNSAPEGAGGVPGTGGASSGGVPSGGSPSGGTRATGGHGMAGSPLLGEGGNLVDPIECGEEFPVCGVCPDVENKCASNADCGREEMCCGTCAREPYCLTVALRESCDVAELSCRTDEDEPLPDLTVRAESATCGDHGTIGFAVCNRGWTVNEAPPVTVRVLLDSDMETVERCSAQVAIPDDSSCIRMTCTPSGGVEPAQELRVHVNLEAAVIECNMRNNSDAVPSCD